MKIGANITALGRFVVDIDGCLRATDLTHLTANDVIELKGSVQGRCDVVRIVSGEAVPMASCDRVKLDENYVAYFRTFSGNHLFRTPSGRSAAATGHADRPKNLRTTATSPPL